MHLKAVDLFCGAGGISCGLEMSGVEIIAGIDFEPKYLSTFGYNFPNAKAIRADASKLNPYDLMKQIGLDRGELDFLVGGPPCQGFSKNVPRKNRWLDDPRNLLIKTFLDYAEILRPKHILIENVAEMKNGFEQSYTRDITERLAKLGYKVNHTVLNAADYGVPQRRKRAFFIASNSDEIPEIPRPTHFPHKNRIDFLEQHVSVWEAIGDLPSLIHGEGAKEATYLIPPQNEYQRFMRDGSYKLTNHVARKLQPTQYQRLASLKPGQGHDDLPPELKVKSGYSGAYGRLTKDMVAPTITRWVFHPGSGRWGHPVDIRTLTIREVARIQSFPDTYEFVGTYNDQAGQLGNAAPPLLVKALVKSILEKPKSTFQAELAFV